MTREETIQELCEWLQQMIDHGVPNYSAKRGALAMAIVLLSAETHDSGLISRANLIAQLEEWKKNPNNDDSAVDLVNHFIGIIKAQPSAEQVTSKLQNPCDSLLTDDKDDSKEQKSKLEPSDLISRAELLRELLNTTMYLGNATDFNYMIPITSVENIIANAPSVSAERVGVWIHDGQKFKGGLDWCHCSECGQKTSTNGLSLYNYCPNCGARMENKK